MSLPELSRISSFVIAGVKAKLGTCASVMNASQMISTCTATFARKRSSMKGIVNQSFLWSFSMKGKSGLISEEQSKYALTKPS